MIKRILGKEHILKLIAIILLLVLCINFIFIPNIQNVYATPTQELIDNNPMEDKNDKLEDGKSTNVVRDGATDDSGKNILNFGEWVIDMIVSFFTGGVALLAAGAQKLMELMYHEETTGNLGTFTIENLVFNKVGIIDANFLKTNSNVDGFNQNLKNNVAKWHFIIRDFALIILLITIIVLAIKLMIKQVTGTSTTSGKYNLMLTDLIVSAGIAAGIIIYIAFISYLSDFFVEILAKIKVVLVPSGVKNFEEVIIYRAGLLHQSIDNVTYAECLISYIFLVIIQFKFLMLFIKRLFALAFLTVVSPLISVTYAVDRFNDGEAQIFNRWIIEFTKLTFIMPFYALIYLIFVSGASGLTETVPILGLLFLLSFGRIEAIVKEFFGLSAITAIKSTGGIFGK